MKTQMFETWEQNVTRVVIPFLNLHYYYSSLQITGEIPYVLYAKHVVVCVVILFVIIAVRGDTFLCVR